MGRFILVVDPDKCTGCRTCEVICSLHHEGESNPLLSRVEITKLEALGIDIPCLCQQCEKPVCRSVCTAKAIQRDENTNAMLVDQDKCTGCELCVFACPFGAPSLILLKGKRKAINCDLCGGDPMCAKLCETGAIAFIEANAEGLERKKKSIKKLLFYTRRKRGVLKHSRYLKQIVEA